MRQTVDCAEAPRVPRSQSSRKRQRLPPHVVAAVDGAPPAKTSRARPRGVSNARRLARHSSQAGRAQGLEAQGRGTDGPGRHSGRSCWPREGAADHSAGGPGPPWPPHGDVARTQGSLEGALFPGKAAAPQQLWRTALRTVATRDRTGTHQTP